MSSMSAENDTGSKSEGQEVPKEEFPDVPEAAIVRPEDERPAKMHIRAEENLEESESGVESTDSSSEDMDGDGSPDWVPP